MVGKISGLWRRILRQTKSTPSMKFRRSFSAGSLAELAEYCPNQSEITSICCALTLTAHSQLYRLSETTGSAKVTILARKAAAAELNCYNVLQDWGESRPGDPRLIEGLNRVFALANERGDELALLSYRLIIGVFEDFLLTVAGLVGIGKPLPFSHREHREVWAEVQKYLAEAAGDRLGLAYSLSLWGRRLAGDVLLWPRQLLASAQDKSAGSLERLISELAAAHSGRMARMGLVA